MFSKNEVSQVFNELTFSFKNKELVHNQKIELLASINSSFFVFECIFKYGSVNFFEIINFKNQSEMLDFKTSICDETDDTKWSSDLYFSDGTKRNRYLDL